MSEIEDQGVRRYRAKPLEVEVIIWTGDNHEAVKQFCGRVSPTFSSQPSAPAFSDYLDLGPRVLDARRGVWQPLWKPGLAVVRGVFGELHVLSPGDLAVLFDEIDTEETS